MNTPEKPQEGPYRVMRVDGQTSTLWHIVGPTDDHKWYRAIGLAKDAAIKLNAAYAAGQTGQWISEKDRLPEEMIYEEEERGQGRQAAGRSAEVLLGHWNGRKAFDILDLGHYSYKEQAWISKKGMKVTHWSELPTPPTNNTIEP